MSDDTDGYQYYLYDPYAHVKWNPQPDITAYELAILLPYLAGMLRLTKEGFANMRAEKRHLVDLGEADSWTGIPVNQPSVEANARSDPDPDSAPG